MKDALSTLERIEAAGGRVYSATEDTRNKMVRTILLAVAEHERDRVKATFAASTASAIERGIYTAGTVPIGYRRGPDRRLVPDPDTAPIVVGVFERRAEGVELGAARPVASVRTFDSCRGTAERRESSR